MAAGDQHVLILRTLPNFRHHLPFNLDQVEDIPANVQDDRELNEEIIIDYIIKIMDKNLHFPVTNYYAEGSEVTVRS